MYVSSSYSWAIFVYLFYLFKEKTQRKDSKHMKIQSLKTILKSTQPLKLVF